MKILVINCGSSSLKFSLFNCGKECIEMAVGHIDRIGFKNTKFTFQSKQYNLGLTIKCKSHSEAINIATKTLINSKIIKNLSEINYISHRVVHGGEKYKKATLIDKTTIRDIEKFSRLAPLHNPINLEGIKACKKLFPKTKQVAVFDTSFLQTLPEKAYLYAIPKYFYSKFNIRKYGFHGTNHKYVTSETIKFLKGNKPKKIISCHIGNGSSITASIDGKAVETSMGFTPLEGLPMGTRSGNLDPSVVLEIQKIKKLNTKQTDEFLNSECGLKALSEGDSDMRDIYAKYLKKDKIATFAIEYLSYSIAKYIGAYTAAMNGLDAITFTGGMGEKAFYIREKTCDYLKYLGVELDKKNNEKSAQLISSKKSKIKVFIITANENKEIALETNKIK